jgi:hypothetical protein
MWSHAATVACRKPLLTTVLQCMGQLPFHDRLFDFGKLKKVIYTLEC